MNKLLVIRFSAIGDVALSVLAVRALREAYPGLDITVVTREHLLCLFEERVGGTLCSHCQRHDLRKGSSEIGA